MNKILFVIEEIEEYDVCNKHQFPFSVTYTYKICDILNAKTELHKVKEYDGSNKHVIYESTLNFLFTKYFTKIRCWKAENIFALKTKASAIDFAADLVINRLNSII